MSTEARDLKDDKGDHDDAKYASELGSHSRAVLQIEAKFFAGR